MRTRLSPGAGSSGVLRLLAYVTASLIIGGLLASPVYVALSEVRDVQLDSVLRRVVTLTALALLPLYLAGTGASRREALGFGCSRRRFLHGFVVGSALGAAAVAPLLSVLLVLGFRSPTPAAIGAWPQVAADAVYALVAAAIVGLVEEAWFRGALLAPLRTLPAWAAVSVVGVVYAAVHFVGGPVADDAIGWHSGLASIARSEVRPDAFLALLAAGLLLGAMRYRFGNIAVGAGFHAGWVWLMKLNQDYSDVNPSSALLFLAGSHGGTMGVLGLAWIVALGAIWLVWMRTRGRAVFAKRWPIACSTDVAASVRGRVGR